MTRPMEPEPDSAVDERGRRAIISGGDIAELVVVDGARNVLRLSLARTDTLDYGYEGCSARLVGWLGGHVVLTTQERGGSYLWRIEVPSGQAEVIGVRGPLAVVGAVAVLDADEPGLVSTAFLPSLDPGPPLPLRDAWPRFRLQAGDDGRAVVSTPRLDPASRARFLWDERDRLALPARAAVIPDLVARVEERLASPSPHLRLVVESLTLPFLGPAPWRARRRPSLAWTPVQYHRHLRAGGRAREAAGLVALLDHLAAPLSPDEPEAGVDPAWLATAPVELAVRYVRRQARVQASAARAGRLPEGFHTYVFMPAPTSGIRGSRVDAGALPPALRTAFLELLAAGTKDD